MPENATLSSEQASQESQLAQRQIAWTRTYLHSLIDDLDEELWFRQPSGGITHIAWQVGHLAMAQYGLCLFRQRGRQPEDTELMSSRFRKLFSKGTTPVADADHYPSVAEIRGVLDAVYAQAMRELPEFSGESLCEPIDPPYAIYPTKLGALLFCPQHEMLHTGQIGVLRRQLGLEPVR